MLFDTYLEQYIQSQNAWYQTLRQLTCAESPHVSRCATLSWLEGEKRITRYLSPALTAYLQVESDDFVAAPSYAHCVAGKGNVLPIDRSQLPQETSPGQKQPMAFAKLYPERPMLLLQRNLLSWLLMGYGIQHSLCRFTLPSGRYYPLLLTSSAGTVFNDNRLPAGYENQLDTYSFTMKVIESALARSKYEDLENIAWAAFTNPAGEKKYRLVTFDADHGIGHLIVKKPFHAPRLYLTTLVYCFKHMHMDVDQQAITDFCQMDIAALLTQWLQIIQAYDVNALFTPEEQKTPMKHHETETRLANHMMPGSVQQLYQTARKAQDCLQAMGDEQRKNMTHFDLLSCFLPAISEVYRLLYQQYPHQTAVGRYQIVAQKDFIKQHAHHHQELKLPITRLRKKNSMRYALKHGNFAAADALAALLTTANQSLSSHV